MNEFALKINKKIKETKNNLFWSPYSVFSAIAMVTVGSKGQTHKELSDTLELADSEEWKEVSQTNELVDSARNENLAVEYANSIWAQENKKWDHAFLNTCKTHFNSEVNFANFQESPEKSRQQINSWVETKTKEKIKELLPNNSINSLTRMILCNCIYFKGDWEDKFDKSQTYKQTFWGANQPSSVPFMHRHDKMLAFADEENSVICLPYMGGKIYMNIFIPHQKDANGIEKLENKLDKSYMEYMINSVHSVTVRLSLPKFKIDYSKELKKVLESCGINRAFSDTAEFSMCEEQENIKIDQVFHKAFVEVNEEGTEAAAATAIVMTYCCAFIQECKEIIVEADHPFIFTITAANGNILFMGRINQL